MGPRAGFAAGLGIAAADLVHTVCAASGITALVAAWPPAFDLLRYAGVLYLAWLAWRTLRSDGMQSPLDAGRPGFARLVRAACINNLMNPKALLFFMVFLPQFADPARSSMALQLLMLGSTLALAGLLFNTVLGALSGRIGSRLQQRPGTALFRRGLMAAVMIALTVRLLLLDRPTKGL
ncbi:MAG: LysE family translocator [Variovorax sp.]